MRTTLSRTLGALLVVAAVGGLVFSILGLVGTWRYKESITNTLLSNIKLVNDTLETTIEGLQVTQKSLDEASTSMDALKGTLDTATQTLKSTQPVIDSIADLMAQDLPETIRATQSSLDAAQESAKVIDSVLQGLSFLIDYNPEMPLNEALEKVSASMDDLPEALVGMEDDLRETSRNLEVAQSDLALIIEAVEQIDDSLQDYKSVMVSYHTSLSSVQKQVETLQDRLPKLVNWTAWGLTAFLAWMSIAQLGLLTQGWELWSRYRLKDEKEKAEVEITESGENKQVTLDNTDQPE